jgi:hypothetical protein
VKKRKRLELGSKGDKTQIVRMNLLDAGQETISACFAGPSTGGT